MRDLDTLPKVVLHDHLDGGLRPATVLDLARSIGYRGLPGDDEATIARFFDQGAASSLESYLDVFRHTSGVMQTPEALERVAFEAIADHAAQGVVYAEVRFAPSLHMRLGMTRSEAIVAVLDGLTAASDALGVTTGLIVDALRQDDDSLDVASAAASFAGKGVVAFDLAGPERGFPASDHAEACGLAVEAGLHLTLHAGEGDGGARLAGAPEVGAARIGPVYRGGFAVTLNTDNRLMSGITMTDEFALVVSHQGFSRQDLRSVTLRAVEAAFCSEEVRSAPRERVLAGFA